MGDYLRHEISSERIELIPSDNWKQHGTKSFDQQDLAGFDQQDSYDRGTWTRKLCLYTLAISAALAVVCIVLGTTVWKAKTPAKLTNYYDVPPGYPHRWPRVYVSPAVGEVLPLALNAIMTVLLDGLGCIHATTLRWALGERLTFNANLRLFTSSRTCVALSWPANVLYALLMILCYTSTSLLFTNRPPPDFCESHDGLPPGLCGNDVHVAPPALYCLGIGLLGQCALVGWQYMSVRASTWSSNPLDTVWAMVTIRSRVRVPGRSMMSLHDAAKNAEPRRPMTSQRSIWTCHREVRWVMRYIWLTFGLATVFFVVILGVIRANISRLDGVYCNGCGTYVGPNWNILPDYNGEGTSTAIISEQSAIVYAGMFIIEFLVTGVVTMALHCAELVTVLTRDEVTWRHCNTKDPRGTAACSNPSSNKLAVHSSLPAQGRVTLAIRQRGYVCIQLGHILAAAATIVFGGRDGDYGRVHNISLLQRAQRSTTSDVRTCADVSRFGRRMVAVDVLG